MPDESPVGVMTDNAIWQRVANELAGALRTTMLRNPNLAALDWDRASAALATYDAAVRRSGVVSEELPS